MRRLALQLPMATACMALALGARPTWAMRVGSQIVPEHTVGILAAANKFEPEENEDGVESDELPKTKSSFQGIGSHRPGYDPERARRFWRAYKGPRPAQKRESPKRQRLQED